MEKHRHGLPVSKRMAGEMSPEETSKCLVNAWEEAKLDFMAQVQYLGGGQELP